MFLIETEFFSSIFEMAKIDIYVHFAQFVVALNKHVKDSRHITADLPFEIKVRANLNEVSHREIPLFAFI